MRRVFTTAFIGLISLMSLSSSRASVDDLGEDNSTGTSPARVITLAGAVCFMDCGVVAGPPSTLLANTVLETGLLEGEVRKVQVSELVGTRPPVYNVKAWVGEQRYEALDVQPTNGRRAMTFISTVDPDSQFSLIFDASVAGITSTTTFQEALEVTFGLAEDSEEPAYLIAASTVPNNGLTSFRATSQTRPGLYAFRYTPEVESFFVLTSPTQRWTAPVRPNPTTVSFPNGLTAVFDSSFNLDQPIYQVKFTVEEG